MNGTCSSKLDVMSYEDYIIKKIRISMWYKENRNNSNYYIQFSCVHGGSHFVLYLILHPMSDDLTIVKSSPFILFFFIVKLIDNMLCS